MVTRSIADSFLALTLAALLAAPALAQATDKPARSSSASNDLPVRIIPPAEPVRPAAQTRSEAAENEENETADDMPALDDGDFDLPPVGPIVTIRDLTTTAGRAELVQLLRRRGVDLGRGYDLHGRLGRGIPDFYGYPDPLRSVQAEITLREYERSRLALEWNQRDMAKRAKRATSRSELALKRGLDLLTEGNYRRAVFALTFSAKLNQGDPASRVHLAQARLALGHYVEAAHVLRRALELQPLLIYLDMKLADQYPDTETYDRAVDRLARHLATAGSHAGPEEHFLLGFLQSQQGEFEQAYQALRRAADGLPDCDLTKELLSLTKPIAVAPARVSSVAEPADAQGD